MEKKIYVVKPSLPPLEEYVNEIRDMWDTGILTHTGPKHQKLQKELEKYLNVPNISIFANGHLALELGIKALELKGEIITTPFTFGSTTQAILRNGCKPVFCDIREDNFTIDCDKIEDLITDKTVAILPVHVYGNICDVDKIQKIANKHNLKVIYDGAHAFGEKYNDINVSNFGDFTMFSFHATKVFNTVEGGCIAFKDNSLVQYLNGLKQFGQIVGSDETPYVGTNAKLTEMHAAMGLCNLKHIDEYIKLRREVVQRYRDRLVGISGIKLSAVQEEVESNAAYFPVVFEKEKTGVSCEYIANQLEKNNIYVRRYFYPLTSEFEVIKNMGIQSDVPIAQYISERVITLPCYSDLKLEDVDRICDIILDTLN
jgi:dTDP-4-amino-4,6-dideoxygalactose transaminase